MVICNRELREKCAFISSSLSNEKVFIRFINHKFSTKGYFKEAGVPDPDWKTPNKIKKVKEAVRQIAELTCLRRPLDLRLNCHIIKKNIGSVTSVKK